MDSERYAFVPPAGSIWGVQGSNTWSVTRTGFFVATNIKIRQGVEYKSYTENDVRKGVLDGFDSEYLHNLCFNRCGYWCFIGVLLGWGNEKAGGPIEGATQCACVGLGVAFLIHLFFGY